MNTTQTANRAASETTPTIAWDREETDVCQAGTPGCAIDHRVGTRHSCEPW